MPTIAMSSTRRILGCVVFAATSCGVDTVGTPPGKPSDPGPGGGPSGEPGPGSDGSDPDNAPATPGPTMFTEVTLTVMTKLTITPATGTDVPPVATIDITARDGTTPVITDLWLYTIDASGVQLPLTGFSSTAARKSGRLMLPATIMGQPSGLTPADDGRVNGLMTNTSRGTLRQGAFVSGINGTVVVTLPAVPTAPILIVAGIEDQRYAGAAVMNSDGSPGAVPTGVGQPETHTRLSFARDIAPITQGHCGGCHKPSHTYMSRPAGTRDDLVNDNFALALGTRTCQRNNPTDSLAMNQCVQAITAASFLVEPGAPAVSPLLARARPDEDGNASSNGLAWWGARPAGSPAGTAPARFLPDYGDHRMPSTSESNSADQWANQPTDFDTDPAAYQLVWNWVAQGAAP